MIFFCFFFFFPGSKRNDAVPAVRKRRLGRIKRYRRVKMNEMKSSNGNRYRNALRIVMTAWRENNLLSLSKTLGIVYADEEIVEWHGGTMSVTMISLSAVCVLYALYQGRKADTGERIQRIRVMKSKSRLATWRKECGWKETNTGVTVKNRKGGRNLRLWRSDRSTYRKERRQKEVEIQGVFVVNAVCTPLKMYCGATRVDLTIRVARWERK